jgi:FkbM family methyltransferase
MRFSRRLIADRLRFIRPLPPYREAPLRSDLRAIRFTIGESLLGDRTTFTACGGCRFGTPVDNISSLVAATYGEHDVHIVRFWRQHLPRGATFFDVGANIGLYAVSASNRIGPAGLTVAFEAHPYIFKFLQANVARNCSGPVLVENLAVGAAGGETSIVYNAWNPGMTRIARGEERGETVAMVTPDDYCQRQRIATIDYLKIDVEGYEANVVRGARAVIAASPDILIQTEYDPTHLSTYGAVSELSALLLGWGLRPHSIGWENGSPHAIQSLDSFWGEVMWSRRALV